MTREQAIEFLQSLPKDATLVTFEFYDFNGQRKHESAKVEHRTEGVYCFGRLGCGKTKPTVREAVLAYLGGRELICHQHQA